MAASSLPDAIVFGFDDDRTTTTHHPRTIHHHSSIWRGGSSNRKCTPRFGGKGVQGSNRKCTPRFGGKKSAIEIDLSIWREHPSIWREEIGIESALETRTLGCDDGRSMVDGDGGAVQSMQ
jgi:hypothetical protein